MKFVTNIDLLKNQLLNATIHNLAADPSDPVIGQIYFNTVLNELKIYTAAGWDVVGKEYTLADDILRASIDGNVLKYSPHDGKNASLRFYTGTVEPDLTTRLNLDGILWATQLFDNGHRVAAQINTTGTGEYIASVSKTNDTITFIRATLPTVLPNPNALSVQDGLQFVDGVSYDGSVTRVIKHSNAILAGEASEGGIARTLGNGGVFNIPSVTYDAQGHITGKSSIALTLPTYIGGTYITLTGLTFNHDATTRADSGLGDAVLSFGSIFNVIDGVTTNPTGHVTGVNVKSLTMPVETQLSLVDTPANGTWITGISLNNHQVTVTRSNSTSDTISVGELFIVKETGVSTGDLVVQGKLTVLGSQTIIHAEEIQLADNIIVLNSNEVGIPTQNAGIEIERGTEVNYQFLFDEVNDDFRVGQVGDLQPVLTRDESTNLVNNDLLIWDSANYKAVGRTFDELNLPNKYAVTLAIAAGQIYTITHNLNTTDVIVSTKDVTSNEIVYADIKTTGVNTITVGVGNINSITSLRVTVIG